MSVSRAAHLQSSTSLIARSNASQRHHFRVRKMFATTANFPNSFVRLLPVRLKKFHELDLKRQSGSVILIPARSASYIAASTSP